MDSRVSINYLADVVSGVLVVVAHGPQRRDVCGVEVVALDVVQHIVVQPYAYLVVPQHLRNSFHPVTRDPAVLHGLLRVSQVLEEL